uniref:Uncharacterized protein n=1 Tax=viral metagenome TaxID=1070528 RepID=A0A6C0F865_9ZZZZ
MLSPPFNIAIYCTVYFLALMYISPIIDNMFTDLDTDVEKEITTQRITIDIVCHLLVIMWFLYFVHLILKETMQKYIPFGPYTNNSINIVCGLTLVGLQRNLIDKLKYITGEY